MSQITEISKENIEGVIVDTRNSVKFTGDFEWIRNIDNGYVTNGSSIHIPRTRDFNYSRDVVMGTSSYSKVNTDFVTRLNQYPIVGYADTPDELTNKINNIT